MEKEELNNLVRNLLQSPNDTEVFTTIFSIDENWNALDKSIKVPRETGLTSDYCPNCFETIRAIFPKFCTKNYYFHTTCPHCNELVGCHIEFEGYTCNLFFEDYDEDKHKEKF